MKKCYALLIVLILLSLVACGGGGNDEISPDGDSPDGDTPDGDASDGDAPDGDIPDGDEPGGPCEIVFDSLPSETSLRELQVTFSVSSCKTPLKAWVVNGENYYTATELASGSFRRFLPMNEGGNDVRVFVEDADGGKNRTESQTVEYIETSIADAAGSATVHGSIFEEGTEAPIETAQVYVRGVEGVAESGADGKFSLSVPAGRTIITIEKHGYTLAQRWVSAISGRHISLAPAYLVSADTKTAVFTSQEAAELVNSAGDIVISAPKGAVTRDIDVSAISFPKHRSLPGPLPDSSGWTQAFEAFPEGVRFEKPVAVKQENVNGFPAGYRVPVGYYNRDIGAWEPKAMAVVSEDGQWLEFETDHFSPYDINAPVEPRDQAGNGSANKDDCENGSRGSSIIDDLGGQLSLFHPISSYLEYNEASSLHLYYNSGRAAGEVDVILPIDSNSVSDIEGMSAVIDFAGNRRELKTQADIGGRFMAATRFENRTPDGQKIGNGLYPAVLEITKYERSTYMSASIFGGGGLEDSGVETREALPFSIRKAVTAIVDDKSDSPFGAGWELDVAESLSFHDEIGMGLWHRGGRRPEPFITGLPGRNPIQLPDGIASYFKAILFDDQGHLFMLNDNNELYVAESLEDATSAELFPMDDGWLTDIVSDGDSILAMTEDSVLYRLTYPDQAEQLSDIGTEYITQQMAIGDLDNGIDILYPEAGMAVDRDGYIWMLGFGLVYEQDTFVKSMPLMIRCDISGTAPSFEKNVLMQLTEWQDPGDLAYDEEEHALYYIYYSEDLLRRFDIAGRNENIIIKDENLADGEKLIYMKNPSGDSFILAGEKLVRISKEGLVTLMAGSIYEQIQNLEYTIEGFGVDPNGEILFASYDNDNDIMSISRADYSTGIFLDKTYRIERVADGISMTGAGETRHFNLQGQIESIENDKGDTAAFSYTGGLLTQYTSPGGNITGFDYQDGKISTITDSAGRQRRFTINEENLLTIINNSDENENLFEYDTKGRMTARHGGAGRIDYTYDDLGGISQVSLDTGEIRSFTSLLQAVQPDGIGGEESCWATMIDGEGNVHATRYDLKGHPDRYKLNDTEYEIERLFDPESGNIIATTTSGETTISRSILDPQGRLIELSGYGLPISSAVFDDEFDEQTLRLHGQYCDVTKYGNSTEIYCNNMSMYLNYDENGHLVQIEDNYSNVYEVQTDTHGNITRITNPLGHEVSFNRDEAGNIIESIDAADRSTIMTYNHGNIMNSITDNSGATFTAGIERSATCEGCEVSGKELVATVTDPLGNNWSAELRADGNISSLTMPMGETLTFNYNGNRLLSSAQDEDGRRVDYSYDETNQVSSMAMDGETIGYSYDERELLETAESDSYRIVWQRNYETNEITETVTDKQNGHEHQFHFTFDPETGRELTLDTSFGDTWAFTHYSGGQSMITDGDLEFTLTEGRDIFSGIEITNTAREWLLSESVSFDEAQRLDYISWYAGDDGGYFTYNYDGGNREAASVESDSPLLSSYNYEYDEVGRLTSQQGPETSSFSYDPAGRISYSSYAGTFFYDDNWRLTENNKADYEYYSSGARKTRIDRTSGQKWSYEYNAIGLLTRLEKFASESSASPYQTINLYYDPLARLSRVETDGVSTHYQWFDHVLLAEYRDDGSLLRSYMPSVGPDGVAVIKQGGNNYFALVSPNGSVLRLFDEAGTVAASYRYDPYGRVLSASGPMAEQPRRFAGALWLDGLGLYYLRTRFLDPETGQFISPDPVWKLKLEPYMYCDGRPLRCTDPMGLEGTASFVGGQIKNGAQTAMGPAGTAWQFYDAVSGYRRGDTLHNGSHGMRKVAAVTFLDRSPAYRKIMKNVEGFWGMMRGRRSANPNAAEDPCD